MLKRRILCLVLALVTVLAMGTTAFAVDETKVIENAAIGATASFTKSTAGKDEIVHVEFTSTQLDPNGQYLVLMVKAENLPDVLNTSTSGQIKYQVSESNILYIDQKTPDGQGEITFDVYPSSIQDSVILITGVNGGPLIAAIVDAAFILGDVNGDNKIGIGDVIALRQHLLNIRIITDETRLNAADANKDNKIGIGDVIRLRQLLLGIVPAL